MGATTNISWTDMTWNPWRGCTKISPGCANCYAETLSHRNPKTLGEWGPNGTRVEGNEAYWNMPFKWDREAKRDGVRRKVFCASLADVMEDRAELRLIREKMWGVIQQCRNLDWLILTKRPENFSRFLPWSLAGDSVNREGVVWPHVWLGVSVEDRKHGFPRIELLRKTPAELRFLSIEPLLEDLGTIDLTGIRWVIVGGESGSNARPCSIEWIRSIMKQCCNAGVIPFVKQLGSYPIGEWGERAEMVGFEAGVCDQGGSIVRWKLRDKKGADPSEFPEDLKVQLCP